MARKNASVVTLRNARDENSGRWKVGRPFRTSIPRNAVSDARSTVSSNVTGMSAGKLLNGLPLMMIGYATAFIHHCISKPPPPPHTPAASTRYGSRVGLIPMAVSRPWTGNGVCASHFV